MISAILAVSGQLADARTTQVALNTGSVEKNPIMRTVISRFGMIGFYAVKIGIPVALSFLGSPILNIVLAAAGVGAAGYNYSRLKRQGVSIITGKKTVR